MKNQKLYLLLWLLLFFGKSVFSQCDFPPLDCNGDDDQNVEIEILPFDWPSACGEEVEITVRIHNTTLNFADLTCDIEICLTENLFIGSVNSSPLFSLQSPLDQNFMTLSYDGEPFSAVSLQFSFTVYANCDLLTAIADGTADLSFLVNSIDINSCFTIDQGEPSCLSITTEAFPINYTVITPANCQEASEAEYGVPFDLNPINLEISGNHCIDEFQLEVELGNGINIIPGQTAISLMADGVELFSQELLASSAVLDVQTSEPVFCSEFFPGGIDEDAQLIVTGLLVDDCTDTEELSVRFSFNTCGNVSTTNCDPIPDQHMTTCYVHVNPVLPELELNWEVTEGALDFCENNELIISYTVEHTPTSMSDAFNLGFDFTVINPVNLLCFRTDPSSSWIPVGNISNNPGDVITLSGSTLSFNFNNLTQANPYGLVDLNGDGIFAELPLEESFTIDLKLNSGCPFSPSSFGYTGSIFSGTVTWTDPCIFFSDQENTGHEINLGGPGIYQAYPLPGPVIAGGETFEWTVCQEEWSNWEGLDGIYDLGAFSQFFQLDYNYPGLELLEVLYDDGMGSSTIYYPLPPDNNLVDLGSVADPPLTGCFTFLFSFDPMVSELPFEEMVIQVSSFGEWANCESACPIYFGENTIELFVTLGGDDIGLPGECNYIQTSDFLVKRVDPSGDDPNRAYLCDLLRFRVDGQLTGSSLDPYDRKLYACILAEQEYAALLEDLNFNAEFIGGGQVYGVTSPPTELNLVLEGAGPVTLFIFESDVVFPGDLDQNYNLTFRTEITVQKEGLDLLEKGINDIKIFGKLLEDVTEEMPGEVPVELAGCGSIGQWYQILRVDDFFPKTGVSPETCADDYIKVPFEIGYCGGDDGADFPNNPRPINRLTGDMEISLNTGVAYFELVGIEADGVIYDNLGTGNSLFIPDIATYLQSEPLPKTGFQGTSQQFYALIRPVGGCAIPEENYSVQYSFNYERYTYDPDCAMTMEGNNLVNFSYQSTNITTYAVPPAVITHSNCVNVTTETLIQEASAGVVWLQFEYIPQQIESITPTGLDLPGDSFITAVNNDLEIATFVYDGPLTFGTILNTEFDICYEECPKNIPSGITYYALRACQPEEVPNPAIPATASNYCYDESFISIDFEYSDLAMVVQQCNAPADYCDPVLYSIHLQNISLGNVYDALLSLDLPEGLEVVQAYYEHPYHEEGVVDCDLTDPNLAPVPIQDLLGEGFSLAGITPDGGLPGILSPFGGEAFRAIHFIVEVQADCENGPVLGNEFGIYVDAQRNCGTEFQIENIQSLDYLDPWFDFEEVDMTFDLDFECGLDGSMATGFLHLDFENDDFVPDVGNLQLDLLAPEGYTWINPAGSNSVSITINPSLFPDPAIPIQLQLDDCEANNCGVLRARLRTTANIECDGVECFDGPYILAETEEPIEWLQIRGVSIEKGLCNNDGFVEVTVLNPCIESGTEAFLNLYCDLDCDGQPDGLLKGPIPFSVPGMFMEEVIQVYFEAGELIADCPSGCVIAYASPNPEAGCFCTSASAVGILCCNPCPELNFSYEEVGENLYTFTFSGPGGGTDYFLCAEYGLSSLLVTTENPVTVELTPPAEVDIRVYFSGCPEQSFSYPEPNQLECSNAPCELVFESILIEKGMQTDGLPPSILDNGISKDADRLKLSLFPNPVRDQLEVRLSGKYSESGRLLVYDATGKVRFQQDIYKGRKSDWRNKIPVSDWVPGLYFLQIEGASERYTRAFIVD